MNNKEAPRLKKVDVVERGAERDGQPQEMDRRLFFQLLVFRVKSGSVRAAAQRTKSRLESAGADTVIYADVSDPSSFGVLAHSESAADFVERVRPVFDDAPDLAPRPEMSMLGRTYSGGHEQDLEYWILRRPRETVSNPAWPWAIWYPLRRSGAFARLDAEEQGKILREHATIGRAYGEQDLAHDVRLACHGLDENDNDFVVGLVGANLHRLSHVVETMRRTRQTSEFIAKMGPFFVGHVVGRTAPGR